MLTHTVDDNDRIYLVTEDVIAFHFALVIGTVLNETTDKLLRAQLDVRPSRQDVKIKTFADGMFCVTGIPALVFPDLATTAYSLDITIRAPGFREMSRTVNLPAGTALPFRIPAPPIRLRPLPVRLQGRVVRDITTRPGLGGADVTVDFAPGPGERVVALRSPLHYAHDPGATALPVAFSNSGVVKTVEITAPPGSDRLTVSDRTGLMNGQIVRIGAESAGQFGAIKDRPTPPTTMNVPGDIVLEHPIARGARKGDLVRRMNVTPGGPAGMRPFTRAGDAGDGLIFVNSAFPPGTAAVRIDSPAGQEYQALGALADADGFYYLDGLGRVATLAVTATSGALSETVSWMIPFDQPVSYLDFLL